jgi:signal transduction histidine kinase
VSHGTSAATLAMFAAAIGLLAVGLALGWAAARARRRSQPESRREVRNPSEGSDIQSTMPTPEVPPPTPAVAEDERGRAARLDSVLIARMSHDLRSPLNSVVTLSELLRDGNAGPLSIEQRRYVDVIRHSGQTLLGLINDVLELAAVEAGRVELEPGPVDLIALAHDVAEAVATTSTDKGIPVHVVAAESPLIAQADGDELRRIVQRLVEHAIRETSNGYVELEVGRTAESRGLIRIHETSEPLSDSALEALSGQRGDLETFVAGEAGFAGRGPAALPLVLAARLASAIGVRIAVESSPVDGVTFAIELPLCEAVPSIGDAASSAQPGPEIAAEATGGQVLLIEDDPFERQRVRELLQTAGYDITSAGSGDEGLELLRARHFDAVVLDLVMPGMSGLDVLRAARGDDHLAEVPFIVLSALYMTKSERAVLGPAVASVVRKGDATAAELARSLRQAIRRRPEEAQAAPDAPGGGHF